MSTYNLRNVQDACDFLAIECGDELSHSAHEALKTLIAFVGDVQYLATESVGVAFRDHHVSHWDELGLFGKDR